MTTISPPATHGQLEGDVGYSFVHAEEGIRQEIHEMLNVLGLGLVTMYGDLAGSGSDTVRITRISGVGFQEAFTEMAAENDAITPTDFDTGTDSLTLARHGLAKEETQQAKILSRERGVTLEALIEKVPSSWLKTMRSKMCTSGAGITAFTGAAGDAWSFDDELDMIAAFNNTEGFDANLVTMRHPEQYEDLRESIRDEPGYQFPEVLNALMGLRPGGGAFDFLGARNFASHDVGSSGGAHQGFAYVPGAIGWVVASTQPLQMDGFEDPARTLYVPEFGMVILLTSNGKQAQRRYDANSYFGVGRLSTTLFPQRRLVSIDD
jgi:hypothetical protein